MGVTAQHVTFNEDPAFVSALVSAVLATVTGSLADAEAASLQGSTLTAPVSPAHFDRVPEHCDDSLPSRCPSLRCPSPAQFGPSPAQLEGCIHPHLHSKDHTPETQSYSSLASSGGSLGKGAKNCTPQRAENYHFFYRVLGRGCLCFQRASSSGARGNEAPPSFQGSNSSVAGPRPEALRAISTSERVSGAASARSSRRSFSARSSGRSNKASPVEPSTFLLRGFLGRGSCGEVFKVAHRETKEPYAMKVQLKTQIKRRELLPRDPFRDCEVLANTKHPYIVSLFCAFQTASHLIMVLQLGSRGSLLQLLVHELCLQVPLGRLYAAEVLLALGHLHGREIVYRDLKPDNVVLDEAGHCLLNDFALAKVGVSSHRTNICCGTNLYVAPEVLEQKMHGPAVDIYGLGGILFTMLTGQPPFFHQDPTQVHNNIRSAPLDIPACMPKVAASLIERLMARVPEERLGAGRTEDVQAHVFFEPMDWEALAERKVELPACSLPSQRAVEFWQTTQAEKYSGGLVTAEELVGRCSSGRGYRPFLGWDVPPRAMPAPGVLRRAVADDARSGVAPQHFSLPRRLDEKPAKREAN